MTPNRFDYKAPGETLQLCFDFSAAGNSALIGAAVSATISTVFGTDPASYNVLVGAPGHTDTQVFVTVTGGLDNCDYDIAVTAILTDGRTLVLAGVLPVRAQ